MRRPGDDPWLLPVDWMENGYFSKTIDAFSLIKNVPFVFSTPAPSAESQSSRLDALDGMRVISIVWIIFSHSFAISTQAGMLNSFVVIPPYGLLSTIPGQIIINARFGVDTFFFMSAYLVVYPILKKLDPIENNTSARNSIGHSWIPFMYLHRLLRLWPLYIFSLLLWWKIGPILVNSI